MEIKDACMRCLRTVIDLFPQSWPLAANLAVAAPRFKDCIEVAGAVRSLTSPTSRTAVELGRLMINRPGETLQDAPQPLSALLERLQARLIQDPCQSTPPPPKPGKRGASSSPAPQTPQTAQTRPTTKPHKRLRMTLPFRVA